MSADEKANPAGAPAAAAPAAEPDANALKAEIAQIQKEIRILQGKATNRNPQQAEEAKAAIDTLKQEVSALEKLAYALFSESLGFRNQDESATDYDALREGAVEFMKKAGVDQAIWKNIAS